MRESTPQVRERSLFRLVLPYFNLVIAVGLSVGLMGVTRRLVHTEQENSALELDLLRTRGQLDVVREAHEDRLTNLHREREQESFLHRSDLDAYRNLLTTMEERLDSMETKSRVESDQTTAAFRTELDALETRIEHEVHDRNISAEELFRRFENEHRRGVVLIYTEFDYYKLRDGENARAKIVSGWGSGFFLDNDGHLITNKHVVQPWKFDPDLAAMVALGEIRIDEKSLRICAWEAGTRALDAQGEPLTANGYNNFANKTLEIVAQSPDRMRTDGSESGVYGPSYEVHALDNNDLVLLKAKGTGFHALPIAADANALRKLDAVMALGFPRGHNGLEGELAESSPSIGTVRKMEDTIHVTASIIPGNSGGPLIGPTGEVVGIVTRVYSETLGICIKIDHALGLLERATAKAQELGATKDVDEIAAVSAETR